jgi:O-antigen/teichoic acid export membrane protein
MSSSRERLTFFRQSGWMVLATVAGGVFMSAVHVVVNKPMLPAEYAVFSALLRVFLLLGFPAGGLQVVFAQQAAAAQSEAEAQRLSATARAVLRATFGIWLCMAVAVFFWRAPILELLKIANPAALWVTVLLGLASLWAPIFKGILQGRQNFAGLGWVLILDGVGRFTAIVLIVELGGQAAGAMTGALVGQALSLSFAIWLGRAVLAGPGAPFDWGAWLKRVGPLTLGVGVFLFMSNADVIYVQTVSSRAESPFYAPAAMIGLALVTFTTPLAAVMFPKIVQGAARTQADALRQALVATALLGAIAAIACTLLPELPLRILYFRNPLYWASASLIPWFAWCLLPLILANVLISNLLARARFRIVPWLVLIAFGYGTSLFLLRDRIQLISARDIKNPPALARTLQSSSDPVSVLVREGLAPERLAELSQTNRPSSELRTLWAQELNRLVQGPVLYQPSRFASVELSQDLQQTLRTHPQGKELLRANRLLLQEAFPGGLASAKEKLFRNFKLVIGALGLFSSLLLVTAVGFTFAPAKAAAAVPEPRKSCVGG